MKKLVLSVLCLWIGLSAYSQSVLQIDFGSSYEYVKSKLEERVGEFSVIENNGKLYTGDISVGDFPFHLSIFEFQKSGKSTWFNYADFQRLYPLSDSKTAIQDREYLCSLLKEKYHNKIESFKNKDGYICYRFGTDPQDSSCCLGFIILEKGRGNDRKQRLYLHLTYGPIQYIDTSSEF